MARYHIPCSIILREFERKDLKGRKSTNKSGDERTKTAKEQRVFVPRSFRQVPGVNKQLYSLIIALNFTCTGTGAGTVPVSRVQGSNYTLTKRIRGIIDINQN